MKTPNERKNYIFLFVAAAMTLIGIVFVFFAVTHTSLSFQWSNTITYCFYAAYTLTVMVLLFIWAKRRWK